MNEYEERRQKLADNIRQYLRNSGINPKSKQAASVEFAMMWLHVIQLVESGGDDPWLTVLLIAGRRLTEEPKYPAQEAA